MVWTWHTGLAEVSLRGDNDPAGQDGREGPNLMVRWLTIEFVGTSIHTITKHKLSTTNRRAYLLLACQGRDESRGWVAENKYLSPP